MSINGLRGAGSSHHAFSAIFFASKCANFILKMLRSIGIKISNIREQPTFHKRIQNGGLVSQLTNRTGLTGKMNKTPKQEDGTGASRCVLTL